MEKLFSYGTLQQENVQLATFGRVMGTIKDSLPNYHIELLEISDPEVVKTSGKTHHPIAIPSNEPESSVNGTLLEITEEELLQSDRYEVKEYKRVRSLLASGTNAWVYVSSEYTSPIGEL